jgi:spermidine/putrescine transport system permease protein
MATGSEVGAGTPRQEAVSRSRRDLTGPGLLGLPVAWLIVFFLVPIGIVAAYSLDALSILPGTHPVTLQAWRDFFAGDPFLGHIYLSLFWKSVKMSLIVSAIIVALAYPLAYYLALSGTKRKYVLLLLLIAPFLTSYLLRVLAWKVLIGDEGPINSFLSSIGLEPLSLIYTQFAVLLVLGYVWLPFVALPIFVSLESLDRRLLEAASDLGASRWQAFFRITLPLSAPGVAAGFLFVFIPTLGEFITPSLVGGTDGYMYGNQIVDLFGTGFPDWRTGSVLALFLLGVVGLLTIVFSRFLQPRQVATD